ncbi:MAG: hypothetical protein EBS06_07125 [Proteobacteria bacterium]|nr:hypothetical protein [Pseudomonadota bacterium]
MKLINLRKNIIRNFTASGVIVVIFALITLYSIIQKKSELEEIAKLNSETSVIKAKSEEVKNKIAESKKYQEIWKTITANKKFIGTIKADEIISKMEAIGQKYSINKPNIKLTIPENVEGTNLLKRSTITVTVSKVSLDFEALNDAKALYFISEFLNSIPGYPVVSNFEMSKTKKYTDEDLIRISSGNTSGAISVKVEFFWYIYKDKTNPKSITPESPKK